MRNPLAVTLAGLLSVGAAGCATPYQESGFTGGVQAVRIDETTLQVSARGNAFTDPDTIGRYVLRKAAEATIAAGYDVFAFAGSEDRSRTAAFVNQSGWITPVNKPGQTALVKMMRGPKPPEAPAGVYDAREVLRFMGVDGPPSTGKF